MKRFVISVSILLFVSLGLMIVFAEAAVNPSRLVPEPNQPTVSAEVEPNKTTSTKVEPNRTTTVPELNTKADILADPNKIEASIKAFEGLQRALDELDRKGADESRQWLQKEAGNKVSLARDNHENIMAELMFIRKLAVEEGAKKTTAAIDGLLLNRQQRFDKLNEKLQEEKREERKELRRENVRSRPTDQRSSQDRRTRGR